MKKFLFLCLMALFFISCGGGGGSDAKKDVNAYEVVVKPDFIKNANVTSGNEVAKYLGNGIYAFKTKPTSDIELRGGYFENSNVENKMVLKVSSDEKIISPLQSFLHEYPNKKDIINQALNHDENKENQTSRIIYILDTNNLKQSFADNLNPKNAQDIINTANNVSQRSANANYIHAFIASIASQFYDITNQKTIANIQEELKQNTTKLPGVALKANAGLNQKVKENELVTLDASNSTSEFKIIKYEWSENQLLISSEKKFNKKFTKGTHVITLKITDEKNKTDIDSVVIKVEEQTSPTPSNTPPVAVAGENQTLSVGSSVTLDATSSYDDKGIVKYIWSENGIVLSNNKIFTTSFNVGTHIITLEVLDKEGLSDTDSLVLNVKANLVAKGKFLGRVGQGKDKWWSGRKSDLKDLGFIKEDADKNLLIFNRTDNSIIKINQNGKYIGEIGKIKLSNYQGFRFRGVRNFIMNSYMYFFILYVKHDSTTSKDVFIHEIQKLDKNANVIKIHKFDGYAAGMTVDKNENFYISGVSTTNDAVSVFDKDAKHVKGFSKKGILDNEFRGSPGTIAIDKDDYIYVADNKNYANDKKIKVFDKNGTFVRNIKASGELIGGIVTTKKGDIYIHHKNGEDSGVAVSKYNKVTQEFEEKLPKNINGEDVPVRSSYGHGIKDLATNSNEDIYVLTGDNQIFKFDKNLNTYSLLERDTKDKSFYNASNIITDSKGNIYVSDIPYSISSGIGVVYKIKKIDKSGKFIGEFGEEYSGSLQNEIKSIVASNGRIYVLYSINRGADYKIKIYDEQLNYIKEWGKKGSNDEDFMEPFAIALDKNENVYVADQKNYRVQVFDKDGNYIRKWGKKGSNDGEFNLIDNIIIDNDDNIYVSEYVRVQVFDKNTNLIRKWSNTNNYGDIKSSHMQTIDKKGNIYIFDNKVLKVYDKQGKFIQQIGDEQTNAKEHSYYGYVQRYVAVDNDGNIYILTYDNTIEKFAPIY